MKEFIDKLIEALEGRKKIIFSHEIIDAEDEAMVIAYNDVINVANQLAEKYKGGWIPCSERLPEVSGEYYTYAYYDEHYMYAVDEIDCDGIIKKWNCSSDYQIIAWKHIAPYRPKGE